jgi:hypothetical protein
MHARLIAPLGILTAGFFFCATLGTAKPDYTRRTNKECEYCHPPKSRELNEAGKYYQAHKNSLVGYAPKEQAKQEPPSSSASPAQPRKSK